MIKKSQAHKMSTQITLNVPTGFVAPALLAANNADDNALIITNGCRVLAESRDASAGLSQSDIKARLTAEAERTIAEAKAAQQKVIDALQADMERQMRAAADEKARLLKDAANAAADFEKQVAAARSESEAASTKAAAAAAAIASARSEGKADADKAAEGQMAMLKAAVAEHKKAAADAVQTATAAQQRLLEAEKASASKAAADLKAALAEKDKAAAAERADAAKHLADAMAEAAKERERLTAHIQTARERQAGSSTKGADNEHALTQVIQTAFSLLPTYVEHPKKLESGDMLFTFQGIKVMVEGKDYAKTVPETEVRKAERDMASAKCDALLFVSEHSGIQGRMEKGSNTLIGVFEDKPSAFLSNFSDEHDKTAHVMMVVRTLIAICREQKKSAGTADASAVETAQKKIETLLNLFRDSSADIQEIKQDAYTMSRTIETALTTYKSKIGVKVAAFKCRLEQAQSDGTAEDTVILAGGGAPAIPAPQTVSTKVRKPREPMTEDAKAAMAAKRAATVAAKKADKWANFSSQQGDTVRSSPRLQSGGR